MMSCNKLCFSAEEINAVQQAFAAHDKWFNLLQTFCCRVAHILGFQAVEKLDVNNGAVLFEGVWYGPYQSENRQYYNFPLALLAKDSSDVASYLTQLQQQELQEKQDRQEQERQVREQGLAKLTAAERQALKV
jgi:hypothetical protein